MKNAKTRLIVFSVTIFLMGTGSALAIFQQPAGNQQSQPGQQQGQTDEQKKKQGKDNQDPNHPPAKPPNDDSKPAPLFGGLAGG